MLRSYDFLFLPMTLILILAISSCTTANQESSFIKNVPNTKGETSPSIFISKSNQTRPELKNIFPKSSTLQNLSITEVLTLLGKPSFQRSDKPAEIWQYSTDNCTLDLYFYENLDTIIHSVAHYEIRVQPGHTLTKNKCFEIIIKAKAQTS